VSHPIGSRLLTPFNAGGASMAASESPVANSLAGASSGGGASVSLRDSSGARAAHEKFEHAEFGMLEPSADVASASLLLFPEH